MLEKIYFISYTFNIDIAYGYGFIRQNIYRTQRCTRYVKIHLDNSMENRDIELDSFDKNPQRKDRTNSGEAY
jgi:hypothetical protein